MKRLFQTSLLLLSLLMPATASAYSFMVDSIFYNIDGTNAEVTYQQLRMATASYHGDMIIPDSVTYKGTTYPVTAIGREAFFNCSEMTSITLPNTITNIALYAFSDCSGLTSFEIPESVTEIGSGAFSYCSGLTRIFIPHTVTKLSLNPFIGCSGLESITVASDNPFYDTRDNCNAIIKTSTNVLISGIKSTNIPSSVTRIDVSAFFGISSMTDIEIPYSITSIGANAFADCIGLTSFFIPNSVTEIGNYPLQGCIGLESVIVENGNPYYDSRDNCNAIIETITNKLISGTKNTIIPGSVTAIGDNAFCGISNVTCFEIPNSVTSIGRRAFEACTALESIEIPNSVTSIDENAFFDCTNLTTVKLPNAITKISNSCFMNCKNLTDITIPNTVTTIGAYAFVTCLKLASIEIPESVTEIGARAFYNCHELTNITIGSSVTRIGYYAFYGTSNPLTVICLPTTPPNISYDTFSKWGSYGTRAAGTLYVPAGSLSAYRHAKYWDDMFRYNYEINPTLATFIKLNVKAARMLVGDSLQLTATVLPDEATYKDVTWETSDKKVATVTADGLVTIIQAGSVSITATVPATTPDGSPVTATCNIIAQTTPFGPLGDVTGDNQVNISDIILLINYISQGYASSIVLDNADFNCDGKVNIMDVTMLISFLLSSTD